MKVTLYSTHCPRCDVLETKLNQKNIEHEVCEDVDIMREKGFMQAPMLGVIEDGYEEEKIMDFGTAVKWVAEI